MSRMHRAACFAVFCFAAANDALADECAALAVEVSGATNAAIVRRSGGDVVFLKHGLADSSSIACRSMISPSFFISEDRAYPKPGFFDYAGLAGSIVARSTVENVRSGALKCVTAALKSKDEVADMVQNGVSFECQAFTRDGGAVSVNIFRRKNSG